MSENLSNNASEPPWSLGSCLLWFTWGVALSITAVCALILVSLVVASTSLNVYLASLGAEIVLVPVDAQNNQAVEAAPKNVATVIPSSSDESAVQAQLGTLVAITTGTAKPVTSERRDTLPVNTPTPVVPERVQPISAPAPVATATLVKIGRQFSLIPLDSPRRILVSPERDVDLNLKLREPQPIDRPKVLIDIDGPIPEDAPKLSAIFQPNFAEVYTVHDWDWDNNRKGPLLDDIVLVGIRTTPGEAVLIPPRKEDIYQGEFHALLLYASEDSVTFIYERGGHITSGYTIHYQQIKTDPGLLAAYRQNPDAPNMLVGLKLNEPVGTATEEILIAIRNNGTFSDARSRKDWWD